MGGFASFQNGPSRRGRATVDGTEFHMMQGKKDFVFGVLNDYSLGWHIANQLHQHGCELAFSHMPGDMFERRVVKDLSP